MEDRRVFATGIPWEAPDRLTFSLAPDGTAVGSGASDLFAALDSQFPRDVWQEELAKAFATWSSVTNLDFGLVSDEGEAFGVAGSNVGDSRFGDIRVGAQPMTPETLSISVPHDPFLAGTWDGDLLLNDAADYTADELFAVLLHEVGHVIGLDHSDSPTSVMYSHLNANTRLSAEDVAAAQALYGERQADVWDAQQSNNSAGSATKIALSQSSGGFQGAAPLVKFGDIAGARDVDYYSIRSFSGYQGSLTIRLQSLGLSLLAPSLTVTDDQGRTVGRVLSTGSFGDSVQVRIAQADPRRTYTIRVAGARADEFGQGRYAVVATFDANRTTSETALQQFLHGPYNHLRLDHIDELIAGAGGALVDSEAGQNDTPDKALELVSLPGFPSQTRYESLASLSSQSDADWYRVRAPRFAEGTTGVLTATVRGLGIAAPPLRLVDSHGQAVPFEVLVHEQGAVTIQAVGVDADERYVLGVVANGPSTVGNYAVSVQFGTQSAQVQTFVAGELADQEEIDYRLFVVYPQLFQFQLGAVAADEAPVEVELFDASGATRWRTTVAPGESASTASLLLEAGDYLWSVRRLAGGLAAPQGYAIRGASLSLPIGPTLGDVTSLPVTSPTPAPTLNYPVGLPVNGPFVIVLLRPGGSLTLPAFPANPRPIAIPNLGLLLGSNGRPIGSPTTPLQLP